MAQNNMKLFLVKFAINKKLYGEYIIAKTGFDAIASAAKINQLPAIAGAAIRQAGAPC